MTESDLTQIKIGKHKVGFVGLKETFKDIAELYLKQPDDMVAEKIINRLSKMLRGKNGQTSTYKKHYILRTP